MPGRMGVVDEEGMPRKVGLVGEEEEEHLMVAPALMHGLEGYAAYETTEVVFGLSAGKILVVDGD